jgi:hypothetical protein
MINTRMTMLYGICMICLVAAIMPAASALGNGTSWNDNPEHITAMQANVAYVGTIGQAQMSGAITYIGSISNGAGTSQLSSIESQFAGTETSVQTMTAADQIKAAETQMSADRKEFMTDAKDSLPEYNGTAKALHEAVNASVMAQSGTIQNLRNTWWTDRETARMDEFTQNDQNRNNLLGKLSAKGIDVSQAQAVENQIQLEGSALKAAFDSQDGNAVKAANQQLCTLCTRFRDIVKGYRTAHPVTATATPAAAVTAME